MIDSEVRDSFGEARRRDWKFKVPKCVRWFVDLFILDIDDSEGFVWDAEALILRHPQEAKAKVAVPVARVTAVPIRRPTVPGVVVPAAAARHPIGAAERTCRVSN